MNTSPPWMPAAGADDRLVPAAIEREVPSIVWERLSVVAFQEIGSTNDEAVERARSGAQCGLLVLAEHQTAGKGSKGRSWISSPGSGLCFSLVVHPASPRRHWPLISLLTSVAVARALEELPSSGTGQGRLQQIDLKWPNDVLICGRKVAGILVEAVDVPGGGAAVVGVGVNVGINSVPPGMEGSATSLSRETGTIVPRRPLLAAILKHFQQEYLLFERGERRTVLEHWKAVSSMWNGTRVHIREGDSCREATTCGLSECGALRVRLSDGREETVLASDVSIRFDNSKHPEMEHG